MSHEFRPAQPGETFSLYGKQVPIVGYDVVNGVSLPRLGLRMMSDEEWQRGALQQAHEYFLRDHGRPAVNDEEARTYHRRLALGLA